jgi:hypothetical protein
MTRVDFRDIGARLAVAFRLETRPLVVYGSETLPARVAHLPKIDRCIAAAMVRMATDRGVSGFYIGPHSHKGCCPGGLSHTGFIKAPEDIKYFVSTGRADVRDGAAEYLKADPELVEQCRQAAGEVRPPGRYLVVRACETLPDEMPPVRSLCFFGNAEQVRNMAALVHFDRDDPFSPVIVPWGPACATMVTYPAALAEHTPTHTAFMGPQDPTRNHAIPPDMMVLGVPARIAVRMAANLDASFVVKRPGVAFPGHT